MSARPASGRGPAASGLRGKLLAELLRHEGDVHLYHLSQAAPTTSAFVIRDALTALVREGLAARCPQQGPDYWRAVGGDEQPCLLRIERRGVSGRARPTRAQSERLDELIRTRYPLGGAAAVLAVTDGVTDNMIMVRASRMGLRCAR